MSERKPIPVGQRFGQLTVIGFSHLDHHHQSHYLCRCDCGETCTPVRSNLIQGKTRTCGHTLNARGVSIERSHHLTKTPEYRVWAGMRQRCTNPKNKSWKNYGGRGITCEFETFDQFIEALGPRPTPNHTLERVNNELGYSAKNCIWMERSAQSNNRRNVPHYDFRGERLTTRDLAERSENSLDTIWYRLQHGWCAECAVSLPSDSPRGPRCPHIAAEDVRLGQKVLFGGLELNVREWSKRTGIPATSIWNRLLRGWCVQCTMTVPPSPASRCPHKTPP